MQSIDFGTIPDIEKKLLPSEIAGLNTIFQEPQIQGELEEAEKKRKIREKWKVWILVICIVLGLNSLIMPPLLMVALIVYGVANGVLIMMFSKFIDIPLKRDVLSRICPLLYSRLQYSHDAMFSFSELGTLRGGGLLGSYDQIDTTEDSIYFDAQKDGKNFSVHGFELKTSEMRGSGKSRKRVISNHCYLMRVDFPHARIPIQSSLLIQSDKLNSLSSATILLPIMATVAIFSFSLAWLDNIALSAGLSAGIGIIIYLLQKKYYQKNRVEMENMEFEKLFDVKCDDPVTSRMIITPSFMDRLTELVKKTGNRYEFLLQNNTMYIKRYIIGNYLEIDTKKDLTKNISGFVQFYVDMREIMLFTADMNLMYLSKTVIETTGENTVSDKIIPITPLPYHPGTAIKVIGKAKILGSVTIQKTTLW